MFRANKSVLVSGSSANENAVYYIEGACVAADEGDLPTEGLAMGSKIYVVDEGTWIYYDEANEGWVDSSGSPINGGSDVVEIGGEK